MGGWGATWLCHGHPFHRLQKGPNGREDSHRCKQVLGAKTWLLVLQHVGMALGCLGPCCIVTCLCYQVVALLQNLDRVVASGTVMR